MEQANSTLDDIRSVEDPHLLRLESVLNEMVRRGGLKGAARELGIDHRTVKVSLDEGRLTRRCREALERALVERADADVADQGRRLETLEERLDDISDRLGSGLEAVRSGFEEREARLREEFARGMGRIGRRLSDLEEARESPVAEAKAGPPVPAPRGVIRRENPGLVTREPAPDDPEVFGDAWQLVTDWRELRDAHPGEGRGMSWLMDEERLLAMELAMLEEHGLTLPPETGPLRGFARRGQTGWRRAALDDTRRALARRRLLRGVLTLGLWHLWRRRHSAASRPLALWRRMPGIRPISVDRGRRTDAILGALFSAFSGVWARCKSRGRDPCCPGERLGSSEALPDRPERE